MLNTAARAGVLVCVLTAGVLAMTAESTGRQTFSPDLETITAIPVPFLDGFGRKLGTAAVQNGGDAVLVRVDLEGVPAGAHELRWRQADTCESRTDRPGSRATHQGNGEDGDLPASTIVNAGSDGRVRALVLASQTEPVPASSFRVLELLEGTGAQAPAVNSRRQLSCAVIVAGL